MQPVASTHPSLTSSSCDIHDDATCTTRHRSSASFEANWEILDWLASRRSKLLDLDTCPTPSSSHQFCGATDKSSSAWFWGPKQETVTVILRPKSPNHNCRFWGPNRETRRPWFWESTKKHALLISLCTVQIAHGVTRPLDHLAIEYLTCAWSSPILFTSSPTPAMILVVVRHIIPVTYTSRDKQTWFSTRIDRGRTTETSRIRIQATANQWLITIKPMYWPLCFSISPLMSTLTKNTKFEFLI
jgi:hypothetical protein